MAELGDYVLKELEFCVECGAKDELCEDCDRCNDCCECNHAAA